MHFCICKVFLSNTNSVGKGLSFPDIQMWTVWGLQVVSIITKEVGHISCYDVDWSPKRTAGIPLSKPIM